MSDIDRISLICRVHSNATGLVDVLFLAIRSGIKLHNFPFDSMYLSLESLFRRWGDLSFGLLQPSAPKKYAYFIVRF